VECPKQPANDRGRRLKGRDEGEYQSTQQIEEAGIFSFQGNLLTWTCFYVLLDNIQGQCDSREFLDVWGLPFMKSKLYDEILRCDRGYIAPATFTQQTLFWEQARALSVTLKHVARQAVWKKPSLPWEGISHAEAFCTASTSGEAGEEGIPSPAGRRVGECVSTYEDMIRITTNHSNDLGGWSYLLIGKCKGIITPLAPSKK